MSKASVVLGPTRIEMVNQLLARLAIEAIQILIGKGPQQQFGLIQPTGMGWGIDDPQARMGGEVSSGMVINMGAAVVHNQMEAAGMAIVPRHLADTPQEVLMIVFVDTPATHRAIVNIEGHYQRDRAMPLILKLAPFDVARVHPLARGRTRQGLDIGFLIQTEHDFSMLMQPRHALITPQHLRGQGQKRLINHGRLPVAAAMGVQAGLGENLRYRCVMNRVHDSLLDHTLLQTTAVPVCEV